MGFDSDDAREMIKEQREGGDVMEWGTPAEQEAYERREIQPLPATEDIFDFACCLTRMHAAQCLGSCPICPECGEPRPEDERVLAGLKCRFCAY
jgi:formylmethanofuran dehydrogenase subunit E